jgi:hypothetical protein
VVIRVPQVPLAEPASTPPGARAPQLPEWVNRRG